MSTQKKTTASTEPCSQKIRRLKRAVEEADGIVIGAGAGLSEAAGLAYSGRRFEEYFADFLPVYPFRDMYTAGFYPFSSPEAYWAYWSRHILVNRYLPGQTQPYRELWELVKDRDYFVLTTNVDHQFQRNGFDKQRLFYMQGDYGLWQCSKPCRPVTYDNEQTVRQMAAEQRSLRIPCRLVPHCPHCGAPLSMNLRTDETFVQDEGWYDARRRYENFLCRHSSSRLLFWELGVGWNTPGIIKYSFWEMTARLPQALYACVNNRRADCPPAIEKQSICVEKDLLIVLHQLISV